MWGKGGTSKIQKTIREVESALEGHGSMPDLIRNESRYINNVKKILIPGGKFLITTDSKQAPGISIALQKAGFKVTTRELKPQEIQAKGSKWAKNEITEGRQVIRIIAQKPK